MFLGAVVALEVGKNRVESVGEVEEGADLISYYCDRLVEHHEFRTDQESQTGEDRNVSVLRPYGVFGVISPFNFPSALAAGPIGAALVAGNTVVFKPRRDDAVVGRAAGRDPARGRRARRRAEPRHRRPRRRQGAGGRTRRRRDRVHRLATTSAARSTARSRSESLLRGPASPRWAARTRPSSRPPPTSTRRRTASCARPSGASGQKCSACSRVLVEDGVHDALVEKLAEGAKSWTVADPAAADCRLGPVNNAEAYEKYRQAAADARRDGRVVAGAELLTDGAFANGYFVAPTIVADLPAGHRLTRDELFVPFVTVERVADLEAGIAAANDQSTRPHRRSVQRGREREAAVPRRHRGRRRLRQPRGRGDHRRVARLPDLRRLEGFRFHRQIGLRAALRPAVHARAVAHDSPVR